MLLNLQTILKVNFYSELLFKMQLDGIQLEVGALKLEEPQEVVPYKQQFFPSRQGYKTSLLC